MITTLESIQTDIAKAKVDIATSEREFPKLIDVFNNIPGKVFYAYFYPHDAKIIAHVDTRAAFAPIRALRHGKWEKTITRDNGEGCARYEGVSDGGVKLHIYVRELPPSCRIVETQELLPAEPAKPERLVTVRKVKCDATTAADVKRNLEPSLV